MNDQPSLAAMFGRPVSLGEQLAEARLQAFVRSAVIGTLLMRLGEDKLELDIAAYLDSTAISGVTLEFSQFNSKVKLTLERPESTNGKPEPDWVKGLREAIGNEDAPGAVVNL